MAQQGTDLPAFLSDLRLALAEAQQDVLEEALKRADDALKVGTESEIERLATEISDATGCTVRTAGSVLKCVIFLAGSAIGSESVPDVDKMVGAITRLAKPEEGGITPEEQPKLKRLLEKLAGETKAMKQAFLTGRVIRGVLPMFQDFQATLELRSNKAPLWSKGEDEDSAAGPLELIPIASIRLVLDSGDPRAICFQAREEDLAEMQRRIEKLQIELKALREQVHVAAR